MNHNFSKIDKVCPPACSPTKRGFSLVELLIVLAIMVIMTAVLFVNQNDKKVTSNVETATRQVAAQIRALQNEALNGKKIGTTYVNKYKFSAVNSSSVYTVTYIDSAGGTIGTPQDIDLESKRVSFVWAVGNLYFSSPNGRVDAANSIIIKSTTANVCMQVVVSIKGSITEEKITCP